MPKKSDFSPDIRSLMDQCARGFCHGTPWNTPPADYQAPKCKPLDSERKEFLLNRYSDLSKNPLCQRLLTFGGESVVVPPIEEDEAKIFGRGQFFSPRGLRRMRGEPSQCHSNTCSLWNANRKKLILCTGYALSDDGVWRQHSWCAMPSSRACAIVETTTKRVAYYGFAMTDEEAKLFCFDNL